MPDYSLGKIYKIVSDTSDQIYIGSTTQSLSQRLGGHVRDYRRYSVDISNPYCSSYEVLNNGNYRIILLENYPCENREELRAREQFYIDQNRNQIINKLNAKLNEEYRKQYYEINKEKIKEYQKEYQKEYSDIYKEYQKQYYEINKEQLKECRKKKYEINKEQIKEFQKQYYKINKEQINERRNEKIDCKCGGHYTKRNISSHFKTMKHQKHLSDISLTTS